MVEEDLPELGIGVVGPDALGATRALLRLMVRCSNSVWNSDDLTGNPPQTAPSLAGEFFDLAGK